MSNSIEYTWDYLCEEFQRFMNIMGDRNYTIENRFNAFRGLCYVAMKCKDERAANFIEVASIDFERRMAHLILL